MAARPRLPLGRLLLEAGILSEEQLGAALAEQQETDRPLGVILVERGFVSKQLVASALAEQHGGVLKTEYGVAVGLAPSSTPGPPIGSLVGQPLVTGAVGVGNRSAASAALAPLRGVSQDEPEEARSAPALSLVPSVEPPPPADLQELKVALVRAEELALASEQRLADLGEELERLVAVRQEAEALLASLREAQAPSEPFVKDRHYLFIPSDNEKGYDYAERPGPAPEVGEELDVALPEGEVRFRVVRLGVVRIPGTRLACAYVERVSPS